MSDRPRGPHQLLVYEYGPDALERRKPHRPAHLALTEEYFADGRLVVAAFVARDPYVSSGLVTAHRVERWTLV